MNDQQQAELYIRLVRHPYRQQETYEIDGDRYVLELGNGASAHRLMLWKYSEKDWEHFIVGDSIAEVLDEAEVKGYPVDKLTLDAWHD